VSGGDDRPAWEVALELLSRGGRDEARALLDGVALGVAADLDERIAALLGGLLDPSGVGPPPAEREVSAEERYGDAPDASDRALASALHHLLQARLAVREGRTEDLRRHVLAADARLPTGWCWPRLRLASLYQAAFRFIGEDRLRERGLEIAVGVAERVDEPHMAVLARGVLGTVHLLSGRLHAVATSCRAAIELAAAAGLQDHRVVALAHQFRGYALFEWNRLDEARIELERAWNLTGAEDRGIRSGVARMMSALFAAQEDQETAELWLGRLERIVTEPMTLRNREWLAAVRIRHGLQTDRDLRTIDAWRQSYDYRADALADLPPGHVARRLHEYEHLLTVLEATRQWEPLVRIAEIVERGSGPQRLWFMVRSLGARAVALEASGRSGEADVIWAHALALGAPEGLTRVHLEGLPIRLRLLRRAVDGGPGGPEARRILQTVAERDDYRPGVRLTVRQREVLAHVARGLSNKEIAEAMGVAETTVRTHLREAYVRLGVGSRTAAVAAARRSGML
jgi:ATP/maltotriose-dependent transcriptional regulator MalT